jgi:hypothetical protein
MSCMLHAASEQSRADGPTWWSLCERLKILRFQLLDGLMYLPTGYELCAIAENAVQCARLVEMSGFEPPTSRVQGGRSPG